MYSVLTATGACDDDEQDLNHLGLADFTSSLHLRPAKDVSTSVPDFLWDDEATAVSLVDWNINDYHHIQSKSG